MPNRFCISLSCGNSNGENKKRYYIKGENNFYIFWMKDLLMFYLIPEKVLIEKNFIKLTKEIGTQSLYFYPYEYSIKPNISDNMWANLYLFNLKKIKTNIDGFYTKEKIRFLLLIAINTNFPDN